MSDVALLTGTIPLPSVTGDVIESGYTEERKIVMQCLATLIHFGQYRQMQYNLKV